MKDDTKMSHSLKWYRLRGDSYSEMIYQSEPNPDLELYSVSERD